MQKPKRNPNTKTQNALSNKQDPKNQNPKMQIQKTKIQRTKTKNPMIHRIKRSKRFFKIVETKILLKTDYFIQVQWTIKIHS